MKRWFLAGALALIALGCIPEPSDPVALGDLCIPATDGCPQAAILSRDAVGRNQLDYSITNQSAQQAAVRVVARVPQRDVDAGADAGETESDPVIVERSHVIPAQGSVGSRWTPQDLGTRESFEVALLCVGCDVRASYVLTSVPLECVEDDDCSGGWFCDTSIPGRCVECLSNADCSVDQRCDVDRGRCTPPESSGCSTSGTTRGAIVVLLLVLGLVGLRRRLGIVLFVACLSVAIPSQSRAEAPVASIAVGGGAHSLIGTLGENSDAGVAITVAQELRWRYFGASVRLGTAFYLTEQPAPPFSQGLRTYMVAVGPRAYIPIGDFEVVLGGDYSRFGLSSNSLVQTTGVNTQFNSSVAVVGGRFRWSGLEVRLEGGWQPIFGLEGSVLSLDLAFALATGL